jgi:hypothetical protein
MNPVVPGQALVSGKAWREFCAKLADAGEAILRPEAPSSPLDRAEGFRYLTRLLRIGLMQNLEAADPDFPFFFRPGDEVTKYGGDNPDNIYWSATVKGDRDYRITASRGTIYYFSIGSKAFLMETKGSIESTGELNGKDLKIGPDGRFEIICSSRPQPGNWLRMTPETNFLLIRQTYLDRKTEVPGTFKIERIGGTVVPPLDPAFLEHALQRTAVFVHGTARKFGDWMPRFEASPNQMPTLDQDFYWKAGGDPLINYRFGYYDIGSDEAFVATGLPPEGGIFWNYSLYNWWFESYDYVHRRVTVNNHTAKLNPDGTVTVIVADSDPGLGNWLDTAGHRTGFILLRSYAAKSHPEPDCKVVKIADLRARVR